MAFQALFTVHNIHSENVNLSQMEDRGIDAADFWKNLYLQQSAPQLRGKPWHNPVDLLTSGIFSAQSHQYGQPDLPPRGDQRKPQLDPGCVRNELC
ncbi:MAG: hypothetical protein QM755_17055 [Luteolibacter sp.]